jgi:catechol 2,3-dioxygenase-like lactoylglutathione lyase family enzyme
LIHHVALEIRERDADDCIRFWAILGFNEVEPPEPLRDRTRWVERGGQQIHLFFTDDPVAPPSGHVALVATDYDGTLERLFATGRPIEPRSEHWGSPRAFVTDPAGHRVELMQFAPGL